MRQKTFDLTDSQLGRLAAEAERSGQGQAELVRAALEMLFSARQTPYQATSQGTSTAVPRTTRRGHQPGHQHGHQPGSGAGGVGGGLSFGEGESSEDHHPPGKRIAPLEVSSPLEPKSLAVVPPRSLAARGDPAQLSALTRLLDGDQAALEAACAPANGQRVLLPEILDSKREEERERRAELAWRVAEVWAAHLAAWSDFFADVNGVKPSSPPVLTPDIGKAIVAALKLYDGELLGFGDRQRWRRSSRVRAAGMGIFYDPWCAGRHKDNDATNGGKRFLEHWRPWRRQRGKEDPVDRFAELYFEQRDLREATA